MNITTTITISDDQIKGLLCTGFEGGIAYWAEVIEYQYGSSGLTYQDFQKGGSQQSPNPTDYWHPCELIPLVPGCAVILGDLEDPSRKPVRLDREAIERGLQLMADKYPRHFSDFLAENDDATTGDVFIQLCVFGEIIYG